jgi:hypothetical protein
MVRRLPVSVGGEAAFGTAVALQQSGHTLRDASDGLKRTATSQVSSAIALLGQARNGKWRWGA